jgi:lysozyme
MVEAIDIATEQIKTDEGLSLMPYHCTEEVLTIGYGRAIGTNGITKSEAEHLLRNDVVIAAGDARKFLGDTAFASLTIKRQAVLINMAFNLGINRLRTFKLFKQALLDGDYAEAKVQMLSSKWAGQVKGRAIRLADMMFAD